MKCKNCQALFKQMGEDKARIKALEKRVRELNPYGHIPIRRNIERK